MKGLIIEELSSFHGKEVHSKHDALSCSLAENKHVSLRPERSEKCGSVVPSLFPQSENVSVGPAVMTVCSQQVKTLTHPHPLERKFHFHSCQLC